jgi:2-dehydropantoate 2-reductase
MRQCRVGFVVFGAGAIGGLIGARLHQHGHDVTLVARGDHLAAIRARGLRVDAPSGSEAVAVAAVGDVEHLDVGAHEVVLLTTKSQHTAAALDALGAIPPETPIVCLQNGVANERAALRRFARVYGGCVMCPATHTEPGVVQAHRDPPPGILDIGRYPSGVDAVAERVAAALRDAGFVAEAQPDIMRWKYTKLLLNLGNAIEAVAGAEGRAGGLARRARQEGVACLAAAGIDYASAAEDRERRAVLAPLAPGTHRGGSSWQSLVRGTGNIEADYLNGEIVLLGRLHGVPTPVNELLQRVANDAARNRRTPGATRDEDLARMVP